MSLDEYRKLTRVALPEDDSYIVKLGIALYSFASVTTFLCEIISYNLDKSINRAKLQELEAGGILKKLISVDAKRPVDEITPDIDFVIAKYGEYKDARNDIFHANCITGSSGKQILHRTRKDGTNFEVTEEYLNSFIGDFSEINNKLYKIRSYCWGISK